MKTPVVEIPLVGAEVTDHNRAQTEQLCRYYGYKYIACAAHATIAKFEGHNEGGPFVLVVTLIEGSLTLDQVAGILKKRGAIWLGQQTKNDGLEIAHPAGWYGPDGGGMRHLAIGPNPQDLTLAMDALLALEIKKKQDATKP